MSSRFPWLSLSFVVMLACGGESPPPTQEPRPLPVEHNEPPAQEDPASESDTTAPADPTAEPVASPPVVPVGPACDKSKCGPAPGMPNWQCADGSGIGGPHCIRKSDGNCGWHIHQCPTNQ